MCRAMTAGDVETTRRPDTAGLPRTTSRQGRAVDSERHPAQEAGVVEIQPVRGFAVGVDVAG